MKNRYLLAILICLTLVLSRSVDGANEAPQNDIRITVPRHVINHMIKAALPLTLEKGPYLKGALWIQAIDRLKIGNDWVKFDMNIRGKNIRFETQLGDQAVLMDIGNINAAFSCNASLRYDAFKQLLYITPQIRQQPKQNKSNQVEANLLQLLSLGNGVEYPIEIEKIQPIVTPISGDHFNIDMDITNIRTTDDMLVINIRPKVRKIKPPPASGTKKK